MGVGVRQRALLGDRWASWCDDARRSAMGCDRGAIGGDDARQSAAGVRRWAAKGDDGRLGATLRVRGRPPGTGEILMPSNRHVLGSARNHHCALCGGRAESWQHRVAKGRGGPTDLFNCVPLCGDGTRGCHGWAEHNVEAAQAKFVDVPGSFTNGRYTGPDVYYRAYYNGERWDPDGGWVTTGEPIPLPFGPQLKATDGWD